MKGTNDTGTVLVPIFFLSLCILFVVVVVFLFFFFYFCFLFVSVSVFVFGFVLAFPLLVFFSNNMKFKYLNPKS